MSTTPVLPLMVDGTLPPLPFLLQWLRTLAFRQITDLRLERLPPGNGSLPDLLASAGIRTLALGHNPVGKAFRWEGWSGARVLVDGGQPDDDMPLHHGELPWSALDGSIDHALTGLIELARLEDANAAASAATNTVSGSGAASHGAAWEALLSAFLTDTGAPAPRVAPLAGYAAALTDGRMGAWNPLAIARRAVVALPAPTGTPPWGLIDGRGTRHPVQVVEGPIGRELLTSVALGPLEAVTFAPLFDPVAGGHWEVNRTVIDNGRVRAELDPLGQVVRLCCDGRFVDWSGPALQALVDDLPLAGKTTTTVLEDGPIRGRLAVTRVSERGTLHLTYTVHAHEALLRVAATWDGEANLRLACPTVVRGAALQLGGELGSWSVPQHAQAASAPALPIAGVRWARLADDDQQGLALLGLRPMTVSAHAGRLSLHVERTASVALCENAWPRHQPTIGQLLMSLTTPARAAALVIPSPLRLVANSAVAWWISHPPGWRGELLLGHQQHHHSRCTLLIPDCQEAVCCDATGACTPLRRTADGDGFEIEFTSCALVTVRWR